MKNRFVTLFPAAALFALLVTFSAEARAGALSGMRLWSELLVPSLLPYFAAAGLLSRLGFVDALGRYLPAGGGIFLLGLSGGYPLGAAAVADALRAGDIDRAQGQELLRYCDNTGPAFAVGAMGLGVFGRAAVGLWLWGIHALCALALSLLFHRRRDAAVRPAPKVRSFAEALTGSLSAAVTALLSIGGYVVFFSALLSIIERLGFPGAVCESLARRFGLDAAFLRAGLVGALELSSGVGALRALPPDALTLCLAAFLLGWGGLCVHFQSSAVVADTGMRMGPRLRGKLLHGLLSALCAWALAPLIL